MAKEETDMNMEEHVPTSDMAEEGLERNGRSENKRIKNNLNAKVKRWINKYSRRNKIKPTVEQTETTRDKDVVRNVHDENRRRLNGVQVKPIRGNCAHMEEDPKAPPEGGWGWVVCFTSMCTNGTVFANMNTFGIMFVALRETFGQDDTSISFKASWVGSTFTGVMFLLSMVSGILADRLGIRTVGLIGGLLALVGTLCSAFVQNILLLYLTYGVIMGTGFAFAYPPSLAILGYYFKRRIGLANGLVTFGGTVVFTFSYSLTLPVLFDAVGFKYTLLFLSGVNSLIMLYALTWKPRIICPIPDGVKDPAPAEFEKCCSCSSDFLNKRIWRNRGYVVWVTAAAISFLGYFVLMFHMVKDADDVFPGSNSNLLPLCLGVPNAVMKLVMGSLSDLHRVSRVRIQQAAFLVMGVTTTCAPLAGSFTSLLVVAVVLGMCDGTVFCMFGPVAFDLVGPVDSAQALGFVFGLLALPASLGPPLAGLLYDHFGNYNLAFHVAGVPLLAGAALMCFIPFRKPHTDTDVAIVHVPSSPVPSADHAASHKTNEPITPI
ncbi:hypothetical protein BaRGS_00015697 [Batillaria attramentaria]|uniref:Major facilitator superfamily (MFS) profile domain-containing protein n=1 Tax=Batillaria attramentaria TaxID=370345 RepID=A0ABD0L0N7_9CAEN